MSMFSPTYAVYAILHDAADNEGLAVDIFNRVIDDYLAAIQVKLADRYSCSGVLRAISSSLIDISIALFFICLFFISSLLSRVWSLLEGPCFG